MRKRSDFSAMPYVPNEFLCVFFAAAQSGVLKKNLSAFMEGKSASQEEVCT